MHNMKHNNSKMNVKQFRESLNEKMLHSTPTSQRSAQEKIATNINNSGNQSRSAAPQHKIDS